jgi:ubiquitin C-terminal hydrolase
MRSLPKARRSSYAEGVAAQGTRLLNIATSESPADADAFTKSGVAVHVEGGKMGLANLGNTCYMASALQCLSHTTPLVEYLLNEYHSNEIKRNSENEGGTNGELVERFVAFLRAMWIEKLTLDSIYEKHLKDTVSEFNPMFIGNQQHDSQELLVAVLDSIHEDLNRALDAHGRKPSWPDGLDIPESTWGRNGNNRDEMDVAREAWRRNLIREKSIIKDIFQGQERSSICCKACSYRRVTFQSFTTLSLPLKSPTEDAGQHDGLGSEDTEWKTEWAEPGGAVAGNLDRWKQPPPQHAPVGSIIETRWKHKINGGTSLKWYKGVITAYDRQTQIHTIKYDDGDVKETDLTRGKHCHQVLQVPGEKLNQPLGEDRQERGEDDGYRNTLRPALYSPIMVYDEERKKTFPGLVSGYNPENGLHEVTVLTGQDNGLDIVEMVALPLSNKKIHRWYTWRLAAWDPNLGRSRSDSVGGSVSHLRAPMEVAQLGSMQSSMQSLSVQDCSGKNAALSLEDCLRFYMEAEVMEGWSCPDCHSTAGAVKTIAPWVLPQVLVLHLMRFLTNDFGIPVGKNNTAVAIPLRLDADAVLAHSSGSAGSTFYELYAVTHHWSQDQGHGHYTAHVKHVSGQWLRFDDGDCREVDESDVTGVIGGANSKSAYVLFYQKRVTADAAATARPASSSSPPLALDGVMQLRGVPGAPGSYLNGTSPRPLPAPNVRGSPWLVRQQTLQAEELWPHNCSSLLSAVSAGSMLSPQEMEVDMDTDMDMRSVPMPVSSREVEVESKLVADEESKAKAWQSAVTRARATGGGTGGGGGGSSSSSSSGSFSPRLQYEWVAHRGFEAFPYDDAQTRTGLRIALPARTAEELDKCKRALFVGLKAAGVKGLVGVEDDELLGCGAFVVCDDQGLAYFRRQSAVECEANLMRSVGMVTYVPLARKAEDVVVAKVERRMKERAQKERVEKEMAEKERRERAERAERERAERAERERAERAERTWEEREREDRSEKERAERERVERAEREGAESEERQRERQMQRERKELERRAAIDQQQQSDILTEASDFESFQRAHRGSRQSGSGSGAPCTLAGVWDEVDLNNNRYTNKDIHVVAVEHGFLADCATQPEDYPALITVTDVAENGEMIVQFASSVRNHEPHHGSTNEDGTEITWFTQGTQPPHTSTRGAPSHTTTAPASTSLTFLTYIRRPSRQVGEATATAYSNSSRSDI